MAIHNHSACTTLELGGFVVAWLISKAAKITRHGKSCRTVTPKRRAGVDGWLDEEAVKLERGFVTLFKRVSSDLKTQEGTPNETTWAIGAELVVPGWNPKGAECGAGKFHACGRTYFCDEFRSKAGDRYIAIKVAKKDLYAWPHPSHPHKIAFRAGVVLHECDKAGRKITVKPATAATS